MYCVAVTGNGRACDQYAEMVVDYGIKGRPVCKRHVGYYVTSALNGNDKGTPHGTVTVYGIAEWREHSV